MNFLRDDTMAVAGKVNKMVTHLGEVVEYHLPLGDEQVSMNELIGKRVRLTYQGEINCIACDRKTKKSFNQGYCYPCFTRLAQCDSCIVKPETCHYFEGTCREPEWGETHCMQDHYVYLANSSGIKVGITRGSQIPTRWMDQGASQALPIFRVKNRLISGLVEVVLKNHVSDKTSWQKMLKGIAEPVDLAAKRDELFAECASELAGIKSEHGEDSWVYLADESQVLINYPVETYPEKVKSFNLDKQDTVEGVLMGIKGQYLIFDSGVINMRKYGGYQLTLEVILN